MSTPVSISDTRYELPGQGITLLGYVVRRMHKTAVLHPVPAWLRAGGTGEALAQIGLYAAGASASFGPAYYQPTFNQLDELVAETDPVTGATVQAQLIALRPHLRIAYQAVLPGVGRFSGQEDITGTTISFSGLGMPAPSTFRFESADGAYTATLAGVITSELQPGLWSATRIRGYGELTLSDSAGNRGRLRLKREGTALAEVETPGGSKVVRRADYGGRAEAG